MLRKILRRGIRHGRLLGQEKPFLFEMVYAVRDLMKGAYPELVDSAARVAKVVEAEEKQFDRVLKIGLTRLNEELQGDFTGEKAFHLYETFGLPLDFMVDAARDAGVKFDEEGFEAARAEEQARARASWKGGSQKIGQPCVSRSAEDYLRGLSPAQFLRLLAGHRHRAADQLFAYFRAVRQ